MKFPFIKSTFLLLLCLMSQWVGAQNQEITVEFLGNCGLHITDGTTHIYTDFPYQSGAYGYMEFDEATLENIEEDSYFFFTHKHADHHSAKNLRKVLKQKGGRKFAGTGVHKLEKFIPDFTIESIRTKHFWSIRHRSYVITWHGKRIFLSGDTESAAYIAAVKDIDWAFIPLWLLDDAGANKIQIDAKMFGIYHLALSDIKDAYDEWGMHSNYYPLDKQGDVIRIPY